MVGQSPFNNRKFNNTGPSLQDQTISDFSGGLNVVDNDTTMRTKYAKVLKNWQQGTDGSLSLRFGCKLKYDVSEDVTGDIIELVYFQRHLIVFTSTGRIAKITDDGDIEAIWNPLIAAELPGTPTGWSTGLVAVDTHTFKSDLIVHNGVDKPLIINKLLEVKYLQDPATGSNVFTPIGKYGTTVSNYACIAGIEDAEGDIYISSTGTSGVYVGDDEPNDAVTINAAAFAPQTDGRIIGLASFRNTLVALFDGSLVVIDLGIMDEAGAHTPKPQDTIVERGIISFRSMITTKNDVMMADTLGYHTLNRNSYGLVDTKNLSELIEPEYQLDTNVAEADRIKCFSVWNPLELRMMTFMANGKCWVNTNTEGSKDQKWTTFEGWSWSCGCTTERGRVFFAEGSKIYQYGNRVYPNEAFSADYVEDYDSVWTSGQAYGVGDRVLHDDLVYVNLDPLVSITEPVDDDDHWAEYFGIPITFDWEVPWFNINSRSRKKQLKFIKLDTTGTAQLIIDIFVDNFYKDADGEYTPVLSTTFVAGDAPGYGNYDQVYGGGRRLRDERPWGMPADFNIMKLRVYGSTIFPLSISSLTILYLTGTFRR